MLGSLWALSSMAAKAAAEEEAAGLGKKEWEAARLQADQAETLRRRRDHLLQKLHNASSADCTGSSGGAVGDTDAPGSELASAVAYLSELKEKLAIYKLTGASVIKTDSNSKVLCFTTSYKGVFYESYHLKLQRLPSGQFKVAHHTLPAFIVCRALPPDLIVSDLQSAVRPVHEMLAMFITRREEWKQAQIQFEGRLHMAESSAAMDFVCCHLDLHENVQVEITLKYSDLNNSLPTAVTAVPLLKGSGRPKEGFPQSVLDKVQEVFTSTGLSDALQLVTEALLSHISTPQHSVES